MQEGPPGFPPLFPELPINEQRMAMTYVSHSDETERNTRILRVKQSIADAAESSIIKTTKITTDLDKGKGHVYHYHDITSRLQWPKQSDGATFSSPLKESVNESDAELSHSLTVQIGTSMKDPSAGTNNGSKKARCRPPSWKRRQSHTSNNKAPDVNSALLVGTNQSDADHTLETSPKRKPETDLDFPVSYGSLSFFLSCVYGDPVVARRKAVWDRLVAIGLLRDEAWILAGDFYELMSGEEKVGGSERRGVGKEMELLMPVRQLALLGVVERWQDGKKFQG
ncbi:hypothetical protein F2Q69_00042390 [Brassica cretica]|uniref:Uncharacterized protein n=1 Tax=Brassica cretica TaxID=69181 RepID=A0A8S9NDP6_BRACR|nr:hypothetical protein F2Q69_00042390 [Brassica cretica]